MPDSLPPVALLAGGLATRLGPVTANLPKSLLRVAGEPFLAHQLRGLAAQSVEDVVICCGHRGEQIAAFAGSGERFGLRVRYSFDGDWLRGTGGAVCNALPLLGDHFFVLYGDSYLQVDFKEVYRRFLNEGCPGLMTVLRNEGRWDRSNAVYENGTVLRYDKAAPSPEMRFIDYGLGVLSIGAFAGHTMVDRFDLSEIYGALAASGLLAGYEAQERFYEIGSPQGLAEAREFLSGVMG